MMIYVEPAERLERIRQARARWDRLMVPADKARAEMFSEIDAAFADAEKLPEEQKRKLGPSAIGRAANFTREYIAKLRDKDE